jgi:hypothetical protein
VAEAIATVFDSAGADVADERQDPELSTES